MKKQAKAAPPVGIVTPSDWTWEQRGDSHFFVVPAVEYWVSFSVDENSGEVWHAYRGPADQDGELSEEIGVFRSEHEAKAACVRSAQPPAPYTGEREGGARTAGGAGTGAIKHGQACDTEEEREDCDSLRFRLHDLLTRTVNVLRGPPEPLHMHSLHDVPELAAAVVEENKRLREAANLPNGGHVYWGAGETGCPSEIRASNGELHTLMCKRCGQKNPRRGLCPGYIDASVSRPSPMVESGADAKDADCHKLDTATQVFFYEQDFYVLSNFSAFSLIWWGLKFDTSEAVYHWEKFPDARHVEIRNAIRFAPSAHEAFKIAERNKSMRRHDWDAVKVDMMREILRAKADQHEYVRRKLLATGNRELIEDSWRDDYWGWGPNRDGKNMLGKLWMEIRTELRAAIDAAMSTDHKG